MFIDEVNCIVNVNEVMSSVNQSIKDFLNNSYAVTTSSSSSSRALSSIAEFPGRVLLRFYILPGRSSIRGWSGPALLVLEDVVDLRKRLFALSVAQNISSLEKYGSILLELN